MRATNLNYLTIIEKKDQMLQTAYSIVFAFSPFFTVGHCPLSLRKILNLPLFHRVNVRIMDIPDISGEGGFIQWKSAS